MAKRKDLIRGIHAIEEAITSGHPIIKLLIQKDIRNSAINTIVAQLRKSNATIQYVPKEKLNRLSSEGHQGIIAITSPIEFVDLDMLIPVLYEQTKAPLVCVLDGVTDVRNFGAIARSVAFMDIDALIIPSKGSAEINEEAIKTSAGALLKINVCRVNDLTDTISFLKNSGLQILAATEKADDLIGQVDFSLPSCIVLGAEDTGISQSILQKSDYMIKIPGRGLDSLNVSVSAGVVFYEAVRQRSGSA